MTRDGTDPDQKTEEVQAESGPTAQYLLFQCSDGVYGINILQTFEILKPIMVTRLPNVEADVLGVINLRGNILPVIDVNKKFGYDYTELTNLSRIVVCTHKNKMMGLVVEQVMEVVRIADINIEGAEIQDLSNQYISGVGRSQDRIFLILNPRAIFEQEQEEEEQI